MPRLPKITFTTFDFHNRPDTFQFYRLPGDVVVKLGPVTLLVERLSNIRATSAATT
jgi:hypothetical protein